MWPGDVYSIYGQYLGPAEACSRDTGSYRVRGGNPQEAYAALAEALPTELCGVRVLIDRVAVPLIYVRATQVNFLVPKFDFGNRVTLTVVRDGAPGVPASLKFGPDRIVVRQDEAAYTGMPVWIRLSNESEGNRPIELRFGIPLIHTPECPRLEVMYNGTVLPELQTRNPPRSITFAGNACPSLSVPKNESLAGRIPLHLLYRFDRPGTYQVRYVNEIYAAIHNGLTRVTAESPWTPIEVNLGSERRRKEWLRARLASVPTDAETLLYDFLPAICGYDDAESLDVAVEYLYHADEEVAGAAAKYLKDYYARPILLERLGRLTRRRGTNPTVELLFGQVLHATLDGRPR